VFEDYVEYVHQVRCEVAALSDIQWIEGRLSFIRKASTPFLFLSEPARVQLETRARQNMKAEEDKLQSKETKAEIT
jgi:predicted metal-dependent HD superfamily phosphohydrolase